MMPSGKDKKFSVDLANRVQENLKMERWGGFDLYERKDQLY